METRASRARVMTLSAPRDVIEAAVPEPGRLHGAVLPQDRACLLTGFLRAALDEMPRYGVGERQRLERVTADLLALAWRATPHQSALAVRMAGAAACRRRARLSIDAHPERRRTTWHGPLACRAQRSTGPSSRAAASPRDPLPAGSLACGPCWRSRTGRSDRRSLPGLRRLERIRLQPRLQGGLRPVAERLPPPRRGRGQSWSRLAARPRRLVETICADRRHRVASASPRSRTSARCRKFEMTHGIASPPRRSRACPRSTRCVRHLGPWYYR